MSIDPVASRLSAAGVAYAPEIAGAARRYGLDPGLLAAVAAQETGGPDTNAGHNEVGDGGHGHGLFQIDDRSHPFATTAAAMDPAQNADYAAGMIAGSLRRYGGDVREALSAYNTGSPHAVGTRTRWADGSDLGYADSVLRHYQRLTGTAPQTPAPDASASPQSTAVAESSAAIASIASLRAPAQSLPFPLPALPAMPQAHRYHRQATDYVQLFDDTDETDS
ncbi:MAG: transglycosylase SLT domain-containing protein [Candidatus Baltobacteraceae bacterium]